MERFMRELKYLICGRLYAKTTVPTLWNALWENYSTQFMESFM
jgi:hypothetical protein